MYRHMINTYLKNMFKVEHFYILFSFLLVAIIIIYLWVLISHVIECLLIVRSKNKLCSILIIITQCKILILSVIGTRCVL